MLILAIESSCDETAVAVIENGTVVRSNIIASSLKEFTETGGVIPEEAARKQVECILPVLHAALKDAECTMNDIDAIAVTHGPGLLGSLLVGATAARALAHIWNKPLIGVHHTLGHLSSTWLDTREDDQPQFPILTLSASGGHTDLWLRTAHTQGTLLGRTRDDAAGEAFDKGATMLGLPYPGGPSIAKAAEHGNLDAFNFPKPLSKEETMDYSFSGLKTALRYTIRDHQPPTTNHQLVPDLAASYQHAICTHLVSRIEQALLAHPETKEVHVVGGVSANTHLRALVEQVATNKCVRFPVNMRYCTDNAAMIGAAAQFMHTELGDDAFQSFETTASLPLTSAIN